MMGRPMPFADGQCMFDSAGDVLLGKGYGLEKILAQGQMAAMAEENVQPVP